jgi:hypothetical protein
MLCSSLVQFASLPTANAFECTFSGRFLASCYLQALLAADISSLTGRDLAGMISKRSFTRASLTPYRWRDLNEVAGPRTLGRAERAANDELARVAALLQDDDDAHMPPDPFAGR